MNFSKKFKRVIALVAFVAMVVSINPIVSDAAAKKYVKSLSVKSSVSVQVGKSASVNATVKVQGKASKYVKVSTSKKSVATVSVGKPNKKGVSKITIKGKKAGSAVITVKTKDKNKKKKVITKKIKVTVKAKSQTPSKPAGPKTPAISLTLAEDVVKLQVSTTTKLTPQPYPTNSDSVITWTSSNPSIATVDSNGNVKAGTTEGTVTITAKTDTGYSDSCTVIVYIPFSEKDYTCVKGNKNVYIEFTCKDKDALEEYKKNSDYTVNGETVSANVDCETYTYTFKRLPETLDDIKKIKLDNPCAPMAATICAFHTVDAEKIDGSKFTSGNSNELLKMLNYIGGPSCNLLNSSSNYHAQFLADRFLPGRGGSKYLSTMYFDGATPGNKYTPSTPYTFTMYVGPYYIPAKNTINGNRPETYMSLISFAGDDSERYIDVYKSGNGNWYGLFSSPYENWKNLTAKPKDPGISITW